MSRDNAYLEDILHAAESIQRFIANVSFEQFRTNEEKYEAVNRKFQIIGEAARRLSPEARDAFPEIPWKLITAMRNIIVHDYDEVDLDVVWDTARNDLPPLIKKLDAYLAAHPPPEPDNPQSNV